MKLQYKQPMYDHELVELSSGSAQFPSSSSNLKMPRRPKTIPGPSRLSGILAQLTKQPRLELSSELKSLKVSYKSKNGDFGARWSMT